MKDTKGSVLRFAKMVEQVSVGQVVTILAGFKSWSCRVVGSDPVVCRGCWLLCFWLDVQVVFLVVFKGVNAEVKG